jgi:magnesium-transporting ATPase (P-type)
VADASTLTERVNCVFLGTNVRSGTARALVVATGQTTQFGAIAHRLSLRPPDTEFDRGIRRLGYLLTSAMLVMVLVVFAMNMLLGRPPVETLLFSIALAVGLSPELLPAILSVNLARGAQLMARHGVLVKRLNAIENLGSMDVLCTDKTGTLTEGVVQLEGAYDEHGERSGHVLELASRNAALQTGLANPLDDAILRAHAGDLHEVVKVAEVPYDFIRKRLSVVTRDRDGTTRVTKGAFEHILEVCARTADGRPLGATTQAALRSCYLAWGAQGIRVLAVDQREPREHGQHGVRVHVPPVLAAAGRADPAQQCPVRHPGGRTGGRQRGSGARGSAAPLGRALIGRFMILFGVLSSLFDFLTFGALLGLFGVPPELFRTGWFVESPLTQLLIGLVVRTRRPFFRSRPGTLLWTLTVLLVGLTFLIPYLPFAGVLGFGALPGTLLLTLIGITTLYIGTAELAKARLYRAVL